MSSSPSVTIVLLNWHGGADTAACLRSLLDLHYASWRVVVVDNASTDDSVDVIERAILALPTMDGRLHYERRSLRAGSAVTPLAARYTLVQSPDNGGFAAGNNHGLRAALATPDCDYVWLLNNDTEVDPDALTALVRRAQHGDCCMVGSVLVYHDTRSTIQCVGGVRFSRWRAVGWQVGQNGPWPAPQPLNEPTDLSYVAGASMFVPMAVLREGGLMYEGYFLYYEEIDWVQQLKRFGPVGVATDSVVYHKEGGSIGTSSRQKRSRLSQHYLARNLILLYRRHWPLWLPLALARNFRSAVRQVMQGHHDLAWVTLRATVQALLGHTGRT